MAGFIVCLVMDIRPAQRVGIEAVFVIRCRGRNYRTIELSVIPNSDIKTTPACENTALLINGIIVAVDIIAAGAAITTAASTPGKTAAR
ncbi:hypothetical protein RCM14_12025 [Escherichia coli]|nr:hypothetical protein [Escherichia coli]